MADIRISDEEQNQCYNLSSVNHYGKLHCQSLASNKGTGGKFQDNG